MATERATADESDAYEEFLASVNRITNLKGAAQLLKWDQLVMMPEGGTPARAEQSSTLSALVHEEQVSDELGEGLNRLEGADLADEQRANVREVRREHDRKTAVPTDLVRDISRTTAEADAVWQEAREADDFAAFAPTLEELVELKRAYAEHVDPGRDPYEVLFEEYEPYIELDTVERVLDRLREELSPLIDELGAVDVDLAGPLSGRFDTDDQEALVRDVLDGLGFDWDRGRLDTSTHPFSMGTQFDARLTTRFTETNPLKTVTGTVHEFGHAFYTQGLPDEAYGTPLGENRGLVVHESQSRLWENHVGRSRAFWEHFEDVVTEHLDTDATAAEMYESVNRIHPDNRIRVQADELTYHMHIVLRFEIERDLIRGDLEVSEVPAAWNDKMESYLGVRPETDAEGCLQDTHWAHGSFGYFPTYSLGSVLAAQLHAAAESEIGDIDAQVREGDFEPLADWLRENVHRHGQRYTTTELVERATGEELSADHFLEYARDKFGALYDI